MNNYKVLTLKKKYNLKASSPKTCAHQFLKKYSKFNDEFSVYNPRTNKAYGFYSRKNLLQSGGADITNVYNVVKGNGNNSNQKKKLLTYISSLKNRNKAYTIVSIGLDKSVQDFEKFSEVLEKVKDDEQYKYIIQDFLKNVIFKLQFVTNLKDFNTLTNIIKKFDNSSNYSKRAFNKYYPNNTSAFNKGNIDINKLQNKFKIVKKDRNNSATKISSLGRAVINKKKFENLKKLDEYKKYFKNDTFPNNIGNIFIKTNKFSKTEFDFKLNDFIKKIEEGKTSSITDPLSLSKFTNQIIQNLNIKLLKAFDGKLTGDDLINITLKFNDNQYNIQIKKVTLNNEINSVITLYGNFNYDDNPEQDKLVNFKRDIKLIINQLYLDNPAPVPQIKSEIETIIDKLDFVEAKKFVEIFIKSFVDQVYTNIDGVNKPNDNAIKSLSI